MSKIIVVTGNQRQFHEWMRQNIVPVYSKRGLHELCGMRIKEIHFAGISYKEWFDMEALDYLKEFLRR